MQGFRGDHFHMHDVGKGTNLCVLGSIETSVYTESSPSLFSPLKLGSLIPHPKISNTTSTEHAYSIPTCVPFAGTNWKQRLWQNGLYWEKENISVTVMLLEDAIVRLGGKGGGVMCMHLLWFIHGTSIHFSFIEKKNGLFFQITLILPKKKNQAYI